LDGAPGGRAGDAASTVTSTAAASDVVVFGAFVVARWADSTAAADSTVVADFMVVVDTDKRCCSREVEVKIIPNVYIRHGNA
jgi:hypothetical protein